MPAFAAQLARLRVAAVTGVVPRDLAAWAAEELAELAPVAERLEARNVVLRQAAALVSGSRWARARRLEEEIAALGPRPLLTRAAAEDPVRVLVREALLVAPPPASVRQLFRILGD